MKILVIETQTKILSRMFRKFIPKIIYNAIWKKKIRTPINMGKAQQFLNLQSLHKKLKLIEE